MAQLLLLRTQWETSRANYYPRSYEQHSFHKLPAELRLKIWKLNLPTPRLVSIRCGSKLLSSTDAPANTRSSTNGCTSDAPIPINLHVCDESRREAFKAYQPKFGFARGPGQVIFNTESDILYFGPRQGFMAADSQFHTCMVMSEPAELAGVRRLAISDALFWIDKTYRSGVAASLTVEVIKQIAQRMPGVQELTFVPREEDALAEPVMVRERMARQIQTAIHTVCQQFPSWTPPPWGIVSLDMLPSSGG